MAMTALATPQGTVDFAELAFRRLPLACLIAAMLPVPVFGFDWSGSVAPLPWLLSLAFVGLPHGAADLAVSRRLCPAAALGRVWLGYAAIMAAVIAGYAIAPVGTITAFVLLSVWHFGQSHARSQHPPVDEHPWLAACSAVARGGITIGVPLAAWPAASAAVASDLLELTGHDPLAHPVPVAAVRLLGVALVIAAGCGLTAEVATIRRQPGGRLSEAGMGVELLVIAVLGCVTDPLFSVGASFLVWHAWRQMEPLAAALTGSRPETWPALAAAIRRIHVAALPLLIPTWLAIGLAWWFCSATHSPHDLAILSIGAYLVVTPAHELLGDLLTRLNGIEADCRR